MRVCVNLCTKISQSERNKNKIEGQFNFIVNTNLAKNCHQILNSYFHMNYLLYWIKKKEYYCINMWTKKEPEMEKAAENYEENQENIEIVNICGGRAVCRAPGNESKQFRLPRAKN